MWIYATIFSAAMGVMSIVVTEILRSVVDRKLFMRNGLGGTQDMGILGLLVGWA